MEQRSGSNRSLAVPSYEGSLCDSVSEKEFRLITEAYQRARVHLVHVVCRAQTHCSRDMLWHRLLVGGIGEEEKDGTKIQGGKTFCASFCASFTAGSRRAFLCVDCVVRH